MFSDHTSLTESSPPKGEQLPDGYTGPLPDEDEPYSLRDWGLRRFQAVDAERIDAGTVGDDEIVIRTNYQGTIRVLESEVSRNDPDDLEGECWQFVSREVNPPDTIIGKEIVIELRWLRDFRPAAVHPEQTQLSDFYDAAGAAVNEWQPDRDELES
jgi:hypothetical protein